MFSDWANACTLIAISTTVDDVPAVVGHSGGDDGGNGCGGGDQARQWFHRMAML